MHHPSLISLGFFTQIKTPKYSYSRDQTELTDWSEMRFPCMRYSCLHGWSSWCWILLLRTDTLESPPPPMGTQPPVESSRIITCARTRTTELPLKKTTTFVRIRIIELKVWGQQVRDLNRTYSTQFPSPLLNVQAGSFKLRYYIHIKW